MAKKFLDHEGLKYLWKKIEKTVDNASSSISETLYVTVQSNQSDSLSPKIYIEYSNAAGESVIDSYQYSDGMYIQIPQNVNYKIRLEDISGYKTPSERSFISVAGGSRNEIFTYQAEMVNVSVSSNIESFKVSYVNIDGELLSLTDNKVSKLIPFGTQYTISPVDVDGYISPDSQTYVASETNRTVVLNYGGSKLKLTSSSNQEGYEIPVNATIEYAGNSVNVTNSDYIIIPANTDITIKYKNVEGFKTPDHITKRFNEGNHEVNGEYKAEKVTINITSSDNNANVSTIKVNGEIINLTAGSVTILIPFGTQYVIEPVEIDGYILPDSQTFTANGQSREVTISYSGTKIKVTASSNQQDDNISLSATIEYGDTKIDINKEEYVIIPANTEVTITWKDIADYKTPDPVIRSFGAGEYEVNGEYKTEIVIVTVSASDGSGVSGRRVSINDKQYILDSNSQATCKVAYGVSYDIMLEDYKYYIETSSVSYVAGMTTRNVSLSYIRSTLTLKATSNQSITLTPSATVIWDGGSMEMLVNEMYEVPINTPVTIQFDDIEGYKTPDTINRTFTGDDIEIVGEYLSEKVEVTVVLGDRGVYGDCPVYIDGKQYTTNSSGKVTVYIPYGEQYDVEVPSVGGYVTPAVVIYTADQTTRNITMEYKSSTLTVYANSNQSNTIPVRATVYFSSGGYTRVTDNEPISIPCGESITVSFDDIDGYSTPDDIVFTSVAGENSVTGKYYSEKVTIKVTADNGESTSGRKVTVNGTNYTLNSNGQATVYIPHGTTYTVSAGSWEYYVTPSSQSYTASSTSRTVTLTYIRSTLTVRAWSNQEGYTDASATVKYGSTTINVSTDEMIAVPLNTSITITFKRIANHRTPSAITVKYTSGGDHIEDGDYYAERVKIVLKGDDGTYPSHRDVYVTVNGEVYYVDYDVNSNGYIYAYIPYDTYYSIVPGEWSGYTPPKSVSYTASQSDRTVTLTYTFIEFGVLCVDTNDRMYPASSWPATANPKGVAIITDEHRLCLSADAGDTETYWGGCGTLLDNIGTYHVNDYGDQYEAAEAAATDFGGAYNTNLIITYLKGVNDGTSTGSPAASYCKNKGGYMGSAGEWQVIASNSDAVNECLEAMGCQTLDGKYYWNSILTSTQMSKYEVWRCSVPNGGIFRWAMKNQIDCTRPLLSI